MEFQSTHSLRSATKGGRKRITPPTVSIHALLAECDQKCRMILRGMTGFNPRTPCGVRPASRKLSGRSLKFQSTHSLRSATGNPVEIFMMFTVSIHALLAECDFFRGRFRRLFRRFNPRTPCGVRRNGGPTGRPVRSFNPRTPCGVRRPFTCLNCIYNRFNPRTPCGVRRTIGATGPD